MTNESLESMTRKIRQTEQRTLSQVVKSFLPSKDTATAMAISYVSGLGLGAIGRVTSLEEIPAIVPAIDLMTGGWRKEELSDAKIVYYLAFSAGIVTAYAEKVLSYFVDKS